MTPFLIEQLQTRNTELEAVRDGLIEQIGRLTDASKELERKLKLSMRETDLKEIRLRRANGYLADRIRDVQQLTERVRKLTAGSGEGLPRASVAASFDPFVSDPRD